MHGMEIKNEKFSISRPSNCYTRKFENIFKDIELDLIRSQLRPWDEANGHFKTPGLVVGQSL